MDDQEVLSAEEWIHLLVQLYTYGFRNLEFSGGEVLLYKDLPAIIKAAQEMGYRPITVSTNGLQLNADSLTALIHSGVSALHFSLDGLQHTHDAIRGVNGSFAKTLEILQSLASVSDVAKLVCTTLLNQNIREIEEIVLLARGFGCRWFPNLLDDSPYYFKGIDYAHLRVSDPENIYYLYQLLFRLKSGFPETILISLEDIDFISNYLRDKNTVTDIPCILGSYGIYLDPSAGVYSSCFALENIGNLRLQSIADILASPVYLNRVRDMYQKKCPGCTCNYSFNNRIVRAHQLMKNSPSAPPE
jgi:MoaA/NifB/PqqE/SkfB family radical SAM enzyme